MSNSVIFYSKKCKYSSKALKIISENNIPIKSICIDDKSIELPSFLKVVPTIIEQGTDRPLEGDFVFKWLQSRIKKTINGSNTSTNSQITSSNPQLTSNNPQTDNSKIQPFFSNEMSGYSDGYSYLNNESPMNHSYEFLNGIPSNNNQMTPQMNSNENSSEKENEFNKDYENYLKSRNLDIPMPLERN